jgi:RNA polymerase primary sigma factor
LSVGLSAAAAALDLGEKVLVLVPTRERLNRWHHNLVGQLRTWAVGRSGSGYEADFDTHQIIVSTAPTAADLPTLAPGIAGLLIADDVNRYAGGDLVSDLPPTFCARLGLTAQGDHEDGRLAELLEPYFGRFIGRHDDEPWLRHDVLR